MAPVKVGKQLLRTFLMFAILAALLILPFQLTPELAKIISLSGLTLIIVFATALGSGLWRQVKRIIPQSGVGSSVTFAGDGIFFIAALIKRAGLASLGLVFLTGWALIYMLVWSLDPGAAFYGAQSRIAVSEFFYLSVNLAVANPPPTIYPLSTLAKAASSLEIISGLALITLGAGAFFGLRQEKEDS